MSAAYDTYDYPAYWESRGYEHECEVIAIREFLSHIRDLGKVIDIGAGFGRLTPYYFFRSKRVVLTDPSAKLLSAARARNKDYPNVEFVQSRLENLSKKFRGGQFGTALMVRVMHHLENPDLVFTTANKLLAPGGYFILEFANKIHGKALVSNFLRGNFTFALDIFPKDARSKRHKRENTIAFINYHPDIIKQKLVEGGFDIVETRSVSNIRSPFLKQYLPVSILLYLEKILQKPLSAVNFGPSIFILARKRG